MKSDGQLAATFREAMRIWDAQKADGVALADRLHGLEQTLRAAWPFTREWKFLCHDCRDYGAIYRTCEGNSECGRHTPHRPHDFIEPCWCANGTRYKPKPKPGPDDFTAAGRVKQPTKQPTRMGR